MEPQHRALVPDEGVPRLEHVDERAHLRPLLREVLDVDPVAAVGPLRHPDDQPPPVVRDDPAETPLLLVLALVDQPVGGLGRAEPVVVELLEVVGVPELVGARRVVARVVEAAAVGGPGGRGELHPLDVVREVLARGDVADAPLLPVAACLGDSVGEERSVARGDRVRQRDRPVLAQGVRIEQHTRLEPRHIHHVQDGLRLQPAVPLEEDALALPDRHLVPLVVPEGGQPVTEGAPDGDAGQEAFGDLVLGVDPLPVPGARRVLEPAIRVRHLGPVVVVDDVHLARHRVGEPDARVRGPGRRRRSRSRCGCARGGRTVGAGDRREEKRRQDGGAHQAASKSAAAPMPPPMHIVTTP